MEYTRAGKPAEKGDLIDPDLLVQKYYSLVPDPSSPKERVSFGTSGHRGTSLSSSFNEAHIVSISKAIAEIRKEEGVAGPLFIGKDTHALSECAWRSAIEVLSAAGVEVIVDSRPFTPTPVISRAIIDYNSGRERMADGIVVTPSHNPPDFGGFKYDSTSGGPAPEGLTARIAERANELLKDWKKIERIPFEKAVSGIWVKKLDYRGMYVNDLERVIDFEVIRRGGARIGVDPLSGASMDYWSAICEKYSISLTQLSSALDPTWSFMTLDHDEKIRIDPSSKDAMAGIAAKLEKEKAWDGLDLVCATDPDADRFGLLTQKEGVVDPNRFLAAAALYLSRHRGWGKGKKVGKTVVSSDLIGKAAERYCSGAWEVPTGFKWFVSPLIEGRVGLAGEESAGLTLLCRDGSLWTTDKDGIAADLLAAEMASSAGGLAALWDEEEKDFGPSW
ncbi:MAG: phosphoglucomutase, partial [Aeriscardovia sp.]|nr:phosphoglucomutase [Aeriscardovia sp.]